MELGIGISWYIPRNLVFFHFLVLVLVFSIPRIPRNGYIGKNREFLPKIDIFVQKVPKVVFVNSDKRSNMPKLAVS